MPRINVKDKRKQQLIEANIASIAKRGLSETTIAHVSQGAGMSRGIVNFYFTTKEAMMQETCQHLADEYASVWEAALEKAGADATPLDAVSAVVESLFAASVCQQKRLSVWVAFWGHASSHDVYQKIIAERDAALVKKLTELAAKQGSLSIAPEAFAYELHALVRGSWLHFLLATESVDRRALAEKCQAFARRVLAGEVLTAVEAPMKVEKRGRKKPEQQAASNVTDMAAAAKKKPATKKQDEPKKDVNAALGDLFALGQ